MGSMFAQLFSFFTNLFSAADQGAQALNNLTSWANEASGTFADKARHDRNEATKAMMIAAGITELPKRGAKPVLPAPTK